MTITGLSEYDTYIVGVSGGKDSTVAALWALDNLPNDRVRLVHNPTGAGWPETTEYLGYLNVYKRTQENWGRKQKISINLSGLMVKLGAKDIPLVLQPNFFELGRELLAKTRRLQKYCSQRLGCVKVIPQLHKITGVK